MITFRDFLEKIQKIEREFMHNAKYSQDKAEILYDECKNLNPEHLARVVNFLVGENRFTPNLSDFKKAIDATKQSSDSMRDRFGAKDDNKCFWCGNLGSVAVFNVAFKDDPMWPHGFHKGQPHLTTATCDCSCEAAKLRKRNNPDIACIDNLSNYGFYKSDFERNGIYSLSGQKLKDYY